MSTAPRPAILASPGTNAVFSNGVSNWTVPVIAWSTESEALTLDGAVLARASDNDEFSHVAFDRSETLLNLVGRPAHPTNGSNGTRRRHVSSDVLIG